MPTYTDNYNLALYNDASDQAETFLNYRLAQSGPTNSNMTKIDVAIADVDNRVNLLESDRLLVSDATFGNLLVNGGFDYTHNLDGVKVADNWETATQTSDLTYGRSTVFNTGTSLYSGSYSKTTNPGKIMIFQTIKGLNSVAYRGKKIVFQFKAYTVDPSAPITLKYCLIELNSSGTMDTIPTIVSSWGATGVNPTLGTNLAYIGTPSSSTLSNGQWKSCSINATIPTNSKNIIVAIWTNAQIASGDFVNIAEAGVFYGAISRQWNPRLIEEEEQLNNGNIKNGWIPDSDYWTYASATTFTVPGDKTTIYSTGTKIKLKQTTVKYFYVVSSSYSAPNTTVTIAGDSTAPLTNTTISNNYFSKEENPTDFPDTFAYTCSWTASTTNPVLNLGTLVTKYKIIGKQVVLYLMLTCGSNTTYGTGNYSFSIPIAAGSTRNYIGMAYIRDAATANYVRLAQISASASTIAFFYSLAENTNDSNLTPTVPMTWAANDTMNIQITYEIA